MMWMIYNVPLEYYFLLNLVVQLSKYVISDISQELRPEQILREYLPVQFALELCRQPDDSHTDFLLFHQSGLGIQILVEYQYPLFHRDINALKFHEDDHPLDLSQKHEPHLQKVEEYHHNNLENVR